MRLTFEDALRRVLKHEGGYVNHPKDPSGATNRGVTQATYDAYRASRGVAKVSVRGITDAEVAAIYKLQYWDRAHCDDLPFGLDYAVFDFAVNSGVSRAAKFLQAVVGATQDGVIGQMTLAAVAEHDPAKVIEQLCDNRLAWLKRLRHWPTFGRGWSRRVQDVKAASLNMSQGGAGGAGMAEPTVKAPGKAEGPATAAASLTDALTDPQALTAAGGALGGLTAVASGDGPVQYALAAVLVLAALVAVVWMVRKARA